MSIKSIFLDIKNFRVQNGHIPGHDKCAENDL